MVCASNIRTDSASRARRTPRQSWFCASRPTTRPGWRASRRSSGACCSLRSPTPSCRSSAGNSFEDTEGGILTRVPLIEEKNRPELAGLIETIKSERGGKLLHLYQALLNSPPVAEGWLKLFTAIRQKTKLAGRYRELAILRVALLNFPESEYRSHVPFPLKEGLSQAH